MWPEFSSEDIPENTFYSATHNEIIEVCRSQLQDADSDELNEIVSFLTLQPTQMLSLIGSTELSSDLPVWEFFKRPGRYNIRPLIELNGKLYWGPHSADRAGRTWVSAIMSGKLPYDVQSKQVQSVISNEKVKVERALVLKTTSIVHDFTLFTETDVYLHNRDPKGNHPATLGDYDVLAYIPSKNIVLNIECKDILPAFSLKDDSRIRRTFFNNGDDTFLLKVERRGQYLDENLDNIMSILKWKRSIEAKPEIVSMFILRFSYWWTRFPPTKTNVLFLRSDMLRDYLKKITQ